MAMLSLQGLFKFHTVLSTFIPLSIFGLPLFDTMFAFVRRIAHGKSPFSPDHGHIHHRLIALGFNQKQTVGILYAVCGILGISAVMFTDENLVRAAFLILVGLTVFAINYLILKNPVTREQAGLGLPADTKHDDTNLQKKESSPPVRNTKDTPSEDTRHE